MSKLVQKRCPQCNAPIEVGTTATSVTCRYCGAVHAVSQDKAPRAPKARVQQFGGGNIAEIRPNVVYMGGQAAGSALWVVFVIGFVFLSAIGGVIGKTGRFFVSLPLVCKTNESITIKGKTFDGPGSAIEANTNCKITIENSTITSVDSVVSGPNAYNVEVRLVNTTLTSTHGHAIDIGTNGKIWLKDKSKLKGAEGGIHGTTNIEVDAKDSSIEGAQFGVMADSNPKVSLTNAQVTGKDHALKLGSNAKVTAKGSTLKSDDLGIEAQSNAMLDFQETTLTSGDDGVKLTSSSGDIKLSKKSSIVAKKGDGIHAVSSGLKVALDDSRVESDGTGIDGASGPDIRLRNGASIRGNNLGIDATYGLKFTLDGGKVESQKLAVRCASGGEIRVAEGTSIKAPKAFEFNSRPTRFDVPTSVLSADQQNYAPTGASGGGGDSGGSTSPGINSVMMQAVKSCAAGQHGTIKLRTTIAVNGTVSAVQVVSSTLPAAATTCMVSRVKAARFPTQPAPTQATQSFTLL